MFTRALIASTLIAGLVSAQEVPSPFQDAPAAAQTIPAPPKTQQQYAWRDVTQDASANASQQKQSGTKPPKKSHKALWITLGIVAGAAAGGIYVLNKRLDNEGHGIF